MRGLQSGAHAEPDAQHSSGVVRAGHGVSERPSNASFGLSAVRKITSQVLENSAITQTHLEIARSARFFSGLLGHNFTARTTNAGATVNRKDALLRSSCCAVVLNLFLLSAVASAQSKPDTDAGWPTYSNAPDGTRYSPAQQINRDNVTQLKVAWTFRTGALGHNEDLDHKAAFESTPILIDGVLFLSTPYDHAFALNASTGDKLWEFDPKLELPYGASEVTSRGVSAWRDPSAKSHQPCALRIFIGTLDARLIALDGANGKPCADFGANGEIDLTANAKLRDPGDYQVTSAPAIYNNLVITGSSSSLLKNPRPLQL